MMLKTYLRTFPILLKTNFKKFLMMVKTYLQKISDDAEDINLNGFLKLHVYRCSM